jgi:hypothetical protein
LAGAFRTSSSISSSDTWRGLFLRFVLAAGALLACVWLFVAIVDPWGVLPASPPLPRVPVSSNARFTMPALARSARFDSAIVGSSSSRLLRPAELDRLLGGHFVNLAMNAATAWEQMQLLRLFTATHPEAGTVVLGLDNVWCTETPERLTGRAFPEWMYRGSPWAGYGHLLSLYAITEAGSEAATMLGLKRARYGMDGYTSFVPPESAYDPARVAAAFARWVKPSDIAAAGNRHIIPTLPMLAAALRALPPGTRKILFFTPSHVSVQGKAGTDYAEMVQSCHNDVVRIAQDVPNTLVADFWRPGPITSTRASYWDPVHYRIPIADRIMADLAAAVQGRETSDDAILLPLRSNEGGNG